MEINLEINLQATIKCTRCNRIKNTSEYIINKRTYTFLTYCNTCRVIKLKQDKIYRDKNRSILNEKQRKYFSDIYNHIRSNVIRRINHVYLYDDKISNYTYYLGCDISAYIIFLESKFKPDMSFENYGTLWCIDHIRPLKPKKPITKEELIKRLHFTNTQPLYNLENNIKYNKEIIEVIEEFAEIVFVD
jgi:hypothetical protein